MNFAMPDFFPALPEAFVLGMVCLILLVDVFLDESRRDVIYYLSQATLAGALLLTVMTGSGETHITFSGSFVSDLLSEVLKCFVYLVTIGVLLYARPWLKDRDIHKGEFYVLVLFGVLGMMIMISAHSLLTLYLGLELLSLSLYALAAFDRDSGRASEAALKYFVLGAIASCILLYGMSLLYGVTGTLSLVGIGAYLGGLEAQAYGLTLVFALAFVVVGLAFKLGAVPFHSWLPDVYHGAPTATVLFVGSAPKIAAFAIVVRLLVEGLGGLHADWQVMLVMLAVLSLAIGNVVAIAQTNIKRMLAYSTISHVGFLLLGVLAGTADGLAAAMFYAVTYAITAVGGFGMIIFLSRRGFEAENIDDFKGLNERSPWFAFVMLVLVFSMAGVPPTVGFYAKLLVFSAVVDVGMAWLAVVAVVFAIIGAFYYLRIIKLMYFDPPEDTTPLPAAVDLRVALSANGLLVLGLGIFPGTLIALCARALA
ncbi:MAG TPA: NADH-quinone oxidoreductase subunit NuoN [Gammaproteobacteria bacterium]|nr:NADH-quinone oxidoreductase subunit NuoN [Gammaproteobacteria bacterium]